MRKGNSDTDRAVRTAVAAAAMLLLVRTGGAAPVAPVGASAGETVRLKYISPSHFVRTLNFTVASDDASKPAGSFLKGITRIDVDDPAKELRVSGDPESISQLKQIAALLDIDPRRCELHVRVLRYSLADFSRRGVPEVIAIGTGIVNNNARMVLTLLGAGRVFTAQLYPHVNRDNTVSVGASLNGYYPADAPANSEEDPVVKAEDTAMRILKPGEPTRVTGMTSAGDKAIRQKIREAKEAIVPGAPPISTFFLEVTAQPLPPISRTGSR